MNIPTELRYTSDHEWAKNEGGVAIVGITDYAQSELGDVVFVELPEVGSQVEKGASFGTIEAVKAVADLFSPVSGEVVEVNSLLEDAPETVNKDPYGDGWMVKIKMSDPAEFDGLMDAEAYEKLIS
ncbi:MAG TPA: glycine cleavage system protein GcvH [Caldithrix abyssi]|uniref:Glycine cleavage system H protein n=1 Tax=Caldithrix abyssi TaxID=187145 RepID=A0A7V5PPK5_CALAY|nr:glycine cleavage system protein GcvH [Caldithrix abyssi]